MNQQLLPCPFCGSEPEIYTIGANKVEIKCPECLVQKQQKVLRNSQDWLKDKMINWWNTRTGMPSETTKSTEDRLRHEKIYDDENPDYIRQSKEEI